jgi:hypothetical protein
MICSCSAPMVTRGHGSHRLDVCLGCDLSAARTDIVRPRRRGEGVICWYCKHNKHETCASRNKSWCDCAHRTDVPKNPPALPEDTLGTEPPRDD